MIIAGADMSIAAQAVVVLPHDLDDLAVSLEPDDAVYNVDSELLEPGREVNIGFLVEPRLELDHDGDLLSVASRVAQIADDASVRRGAVDRHFNCAHFGVRARLSQKAFDRGRE